MTNYCGIEDEENVYEISLKELITQSGDEGNIYIEYNQSLHNFFRMREINGRKLKFVMYNDYFEEKKANGNMLRILEFEYPKVNDDCIVIKINHILVYDIDLAKDENHWPKNLTEVEREITRNDLKKIRIIADTSDINNYNACIQITWTYVMFRYDPSKNRFSFDSIETKTRY